MDKNMKAEVLVGQRVRVSSINVPSYMQTGVVKDFSPLSNTYNYAHNTRYIVKLDNGRILKAIAGEYLQLLPIDGTKEEDDYKLTDAFNVIQSALQNTLEDSKIVLDVIVSKDDITITLEDTYYTFPSAEEAAEGLEKLMWLSKYETQL